MRQRSKYYTRPHQPSKSYDDEELIEQFYLDVNDLTGNPACVHAVRGRVLHNWAKPSPWIAVIFAGYEHERTPTEVKEFRRRADARRWGLTVIRARAKAAAARAS